MSWSRRSVIAALCVAGCGFTPVHQQKLIGQFAITAPETIEGYALLSQLEARLGAPSAPVYQLETTIDLAEIRNPDIGHHRLDGTATWSLSGQSRANGTVSAFTSYSTSGTTVSGEAARADAVEQLAKMLADQIVTDIWATVP